MEIENASYTESWCGDRGWSCGSGNGKGLTWWMLNVYDRYKTFGSSWCREVLGDADKGSEEYQGSTEDQSHISCSTENSSRTETSRGWSLEDSVRTSNSQGLLSHGECTRLWLVTDEGNEERRRERLGLKSPLGCPGIIYIKPLALTLTSNTCWPWSWEHCLFSVSQSLPVRVSLTITGPHSVTALQQKINQISSC